MTPPSRLSPALALAAVARPRRPRGRARRHAARARARDAPRRAVLGRLRRSTSTPAGSICAAVAADGARPRLGGEALHDRRRRCCASAPAARLDHHRRSAPPPPEPGGVVAGDLYLRGGGDPTLRPDAAGALAATLVREGEAAAWPGDGPRDRGRDGVRRPARPAVVGLRGLALRRAARRADLQPRARAASGRGFQARAAALRRRAPCRRALGAAAGRRRARPRRGRHAGGRRPARRAASPPMASSARRTNVPSDNFLAETLLKALGARFGGAGSTRAGAEVVRARWRPRPQPDRGRRLGALARQPHPPAPGGAACSSAWARRTARLPAARWRSPAAAGRCARRMRGTPAQRPLPRQDRHAHAASPRWPATARRRTGRRRLRVPHEPRERRPARAACRTAWPSRSPRYAP